MRRIVATLLVALIAASLLTWWSVYEGVDLQRQAQRAVILANGSPYTRSNCPLSPAAFDGESAELVAICNAYGLNAYVAARAYPQIAVRTFNTYGDEPVFIELLDRYGADVLPVVVYFVENGSQELLFRKSLGDWFSEAMTGKEVDFKMADLTREQIGLIALYELERRGHEMLAEFEIVGGVAKRKPGTHIFLEAKGVLFGGLFDLEKVLVRGERLPTWKEYGMAAVDVVIAGTAFRSVAKGLRGAEAVEADAVDAERISEIGAEESASAGVFVGWGETAVKVTAVVAAYVAVTHPWLLGTVGGWIAGLFGINPIVGVFIAWFLFAAIVVWIFRKAYGIARFAASPIVLSVRFYRRMSARRRRLRTTT